MVYLVHPLVFEQPVLNLMYGCDTTKNMLQRTRVARVTSHNHKKRKIKAGMPNVHLEHNIYISNAHHRFKRLS